MILIDYALLEVEMMSRAIDIGFSWFQRGWKTNSMDYNFGTRSELFRVWSRKITAEKSGCCPIRALSKPLPIVGLFLKDPPLYLTEILWRYSEHLELQHIKNLTVSNSYIERNGFFKLAHKIYLPKQSKFKPKSKSSHSNPLTLVFKHPLDLFFKGSAITSLPWMAAILFSFLFFSHLFLTLKKNKVLISIRQG